MMCIINSECHGPQKRSGVWSSGMILALGDFLINRETKHARGPGFNSQLAPFFTIEKYSVRRS
ncbi:LOW QUALITY PROTEIN: uncharacterized protein GI526_G0005320, partial [Saccharomyces cerevisiae]